MFRKQVRQGIRAVRAGSDPAGLCRESGATIPTYCKDTVVRMMPAADPSMDKELLRKTGQRLAVKSQ
jgi:hypothetical protein